MSTMTPDDHARITRRGQQIFQIAMRMEIGDHDRGSGAEALLYLADAIARVAALSAEPRLAIETVVGLLDKIDAAWLTKNRSIKSFVPVDHLFADVAFETAIGQSEDADVGPAAAAALARLTDAIVCVATLNSEPRRIIEHVVQRLDATDIEAARKEQLK